MAKQQAVIVTIGPDGSVVVETSGVIGRGCDALSAAFETGLGTRTADTKKPEYFQTVHEPQRAVEGGRA